MVDSIVSCLYTNTEMEILQGCDKDLQSRVNLAMMELSSIYYRKNNNIKLSSCAAMLDYCRWISISCQNLYVYDRITTSKEVIYTLADRYTHRCFDIIVEPENNIYHVGVLIDFNSKGKVCNNA